MQRRDFLAGAAGAGLAAVGAGVGEGRAQQGRSPTLERVAIMTLCFQSIMKVPFLPDGPERVLDVMDLPQMYADRYGVHNLEVQHQHFHSTEPAYLRDFLNRVLSTRSRVTQINAASWGNQFGPLMNLSVPGWPRVHLIDLTKRWIDHCVMLGCPRLMMNHGTLDPEVRPMAIETMRILADYGRARGVMVTLENRSGVYEPVVEVARAAGANVTLDLSAPDQETQLRMIRAMLPLSAGSSHVKMNPERYDLRTALALMKELRYTGLYSIEAGSNVDPDPYLAVQKILDVLLAHG